MNQVDGKHEKIVRDNKKERVWRHNIFVAKFIEWKKKESIGKAMLKKLIFLRKGKKLTNENYSEWMKKLILNFENPNEFQAVQIKPNSDLYSL